MQQIRMSNCMLRADEGTLGRDYKQSSDGLWITKLLHEGPEQKPVSGSWGLEATYPFSQIFNWCQHMECEVLVQQWRNGTGAEGAEYIQTLEISEINGE